MSSPTQTAAPAGAAAAGAAPAEGGGKSKKKLLLVLPVVLLVAAGAVWFFLLRGSGTEAAAKPKDEPKPGAVVALDSVNINLAGGHYLKLKLALQASADVKEAPDGSKAQGIAGNYLTGHDMTDLQTAKGRKHAQEVLTAAIVKAYTEDDTEAVIDVYYPEFVSQ